MHTKLFYLVSLYVFWFAISGIQSGTINMIFFITSPLIALGFAKKLGLMPQAGGLNFFKTGKYCFWLLKEIMMSALTVSRIAWRRNLEVYPLVKAINSRQSSQLGRVIYANSITLTPGTVTLGTKSNSLLVHALTPGFMDDLQTGIMDKKVKELFS